MIACKTVLPVGYRHCLRLLVIYLQLQELSREAAHVRPKANSMRKILGSREVDLCLQVNWTDNLMEFFFASHLSS